MVLGIGSVPLSHWTTQKRITKTLVVWCRPKFLKAIIGFILGVIHYWMQEREFVAWSVAHLRVVRAPKGSCVQSDESHLNQDHIVAHSCSVASGHTLFSYTTDWREPLKARANSNTQHNCTAEDLAVARGASPFAVCCKLQGKACTAKRYYLCRSHSTNIEAVHVAHTAAQLLANSRPIVSFESDARCS